MSEPCHLKAPADASDTECRAFARLVRLGFGPAPDHRLDRIRAASRLAYVIGEGGSLVAVAALKRPDESYRRDVFLKAGVPVRPSDVELELGWVFVTPDRRGSGIARRLCAELLAAVPGTALFATTRPDNLPMARILLDLDFERSGRPYSREAEELALFLRWGTADGPPSPAPAGRS
ncbi:MAG: GNAT family N-acetyltransferase [Gemmatimonadota bacterium]|nr:GNAT family N-acetyltransferase [Gemmatimonadota bacterium]